MEARRLEGDTPIFIAKVDVSVHQSSRIEHRMKGIRPIWYLRLRDRQPNIMVAQDLPLAATVLAALLAAVAALALTLTVAAARLVAATLAAAPRSTTAAASVA